MKIPFLRRFLKPFVLLVPIAAVLVAGCPSSGPRGVYPGTNVVLIVADTLRADHVSGYGYERQTTPFLDELAGRNVQFMNARSQASCTFPSVNSILTSKNIFRFFDPEVRPGIPESTPSLAEILKANGYQTAAVSASPIVRRTPSNHNPRGGFGRGFDAFDEYCQWFPSTCVSTRARDRLNELHEPFFLYLHYMDPHDPYVALPEHRGHFASAYEGEHDYIAKGDPNPIDALIREGRVEEVLTDADFAHLKDLYDEDIYSFDFGLKKLFADLEERGLLERTIFVVASDHGEGFYEHGFVKHCFTVYDNETRVPLVMGLPWLEAPRRVETWAQNLDIVPTLLDYLGIDGVPYGLEGKSLRPLIESDEAPERLAFASMGSFRSVNGDRYKLVLDYAKKHHGLYDLEEDPGETRDLAREKREVLHRLLNELRDWSERVEGDATDDERLRRAREIEDELRAVGYLGGG